MIKSKRNVVSLGLISSSIQKMKKNSTVSLYPYHSVSTYVIFVYGSDYQRQINNNFISKLALFTLNWTNLFVILSGIVLWMVKRFNRLRDQGFIVVLVDVMVIFTGGGRLRNDHKLERWFFSIVSIAALFLNAICLGPTLFPSFLHHQRSVDTIQQLAEINPPIYICTVFDHNRHLVNQMLK